MGDEMALRLLGDADQMDPRALHRALGALLDLLDGPRGTGSPRGAFIVSDLRIGSLALAVKPRDADPLATFSIERTWTGIDHLGTEVGIPPRWDRSMVVRLVDLCGVTAMRGVEGVDLSLSDGAPVHLDATIQRHAQQSLAAPRQSLGSVRGRLDRWFGRGPRREAGLVDEVTGQAVSVQVPQHLEERVLDALQQTVRAWGLVERNAAGDKIGLVMEGFEIVEDADAPTVESMVGILGDWTDGQGSVEWVRAQRAG